MSSTVYEDDVDFETEEESSEYEDEDEEEESEPENMKTVTVRLLNPASKPSTGDQKATPTVNVAAETTAAATLVTTTPTTAATLATATPTTAAVATANDATEGRHKVDAANIHTTEVVEKKTPNSDIKNPVDKAEKVSKEDQIDNLPTDNELLNDNEKTPRKTTERKATSKESSVSNNKQESDSGEDTTPSKRSKEKSKTEEIRKLKDEGNKPAPNIFASETGVVTDVSSKKSSKSKKEKVSDEDGSFSNKKKDKNAQEETASVKNSKKDKTDKFSGDVDVTVEEVSALEFVGNVNESNKKTKSSRQKFSNDSLVKEDLPAEVEKSKEKLPSPSSSSSDLEKQKNEKGYSSKVKEDTNGTVIKVVKKKSKKSNDSTELENLAEVKAGESKKKLTIDVEVPLKTTDLTVDLTLKDQTDQAEELKTRSKEKKIKSEEGNLKEGLDEKDKREKPVRDNLETLEDLPYNQLSVEISRKDREANSPEYSAASSTAAGRIEQTRNYLKALTPDDGLRSASDDEKPPTNKLAVFEVVKRDEVEDEDRNTDKDGRQHAWESKPEPNEDEENILVNEDSDFTYRRKSMDEFIKKILAEAREENQKLKEDTKKAKKPPAPQTHKPKHQDVLDTTDESEQQNEKISKSKKSKNTEIQLTTIDVGKELEEINKYFAKRHEQLGVDLEEKGKHGAPKKTQESEFLPKENGYFVKETKKGDMEIDTEAEAPSKHGKKQFASYENYEDESFASRKPKQAVAAASVKKPYKANMVNGDASFGKDDEDEGADISDFLAKFKREKQSLFGGPGRFDSEPKRSAETEELIRERTRNMRSVIDQQMDICQNVKVVSKQLDDLEKELREVRQISLDRRGRMDALETAVNAEYKMYEIEHNAAVERTKERKPMQKFTQEVKDQMMANIQQQAARSKKSDRYRGELSLDDVSSTLKRRVGSVSSQAGLLDEQDSFFLSSSPASTSPYHSLAPSRGRGVSSDRDAYLSSFLTIDRRRDSSGGGSRSRLSFIDGSSDFDDQSIPSGVHSGFFTRPKSRASVATMDTSTSISADDFLAKIRSKYSFLNPNLAGDDSTATTSRIQSATRSSGSAGYRPLSSISTGYDLSRSRLEEPPSSYLSIKSMSGRGPSPSSYDVAGSRYSLASGTRYPGINGLGHSTGYDGTRSRRATSVSDACSSIHYDRHLGGYTTTGPSSYSGSSRHSGGTSRYSDTSHQPYTSPYSLSSPTTSPGGEFKSRFLDKVREKRSSLGSSHDLADRVRARLSGSNSTASYDLPAPPSSTTLVTSVHTPTVSVSVTADNIGVGARLEA